MLVVKRSWAFFAFLLVTTSQAVRVKSRSMSAARDLRVFATTFNVGNEDYDGSQKFHMLARKLVEGHDNEDAEADIVFLGFQEFQDKKYSLGNYVKEKILWQRSASKVMQAIKGAVENITVPPADVVSSREALAKMLDDVHKALSLEISKLNTSNSWEETMLPMSNWNKEASKRIDSLKNSNIGEYPNLAYSPQGLSAWETYKRNVFNTIELVTFLRNGSDALSKSQDTWKSKKDSLLKNLTQPAHLSIGTEHVNIKLYPQKWRSGVPCGLAKHYDTFMYAYVNPFSKWKIKPDDFRSSECQVRKEGSQKNPGCSIDNGESGECGKVVNMMVFRAEKEGTRLKICGLNTHMSFKGTAAQRLTYIEKAMNQTKAAKCDVVFFVGDFNSRAHCAEGSTQGTQDLPLYERPSIQRGSSLDHVLDTFCTPDTHGKLRCELNDADELNQILGKEELQCYEQVEDDRGKSNGKFAWTKKIGKKQEFLWRIIRTRNPVTQLGLREVTSPQWPPTYKLMPKGQLNEDIPYRCIHGEPLCFTNPTKTGKHNPAWTDRILMQSTNPKLSLEPNEYSRRPIPNIASDHSAVTALVTVKAEALATTTTETAETIKTTIAETDTVEKKGTMAGTARPVTTESPSESTASPNSGSFKSQLTCFPFVVAFTYLGSLLV